MPASIRDGEGSRIGTDIGRKPSESPAGQLAGLSPLHQALRVNHWLRELDLSCNRLEDTGLEHVLYERVSRGMWCRGFPPGKVVIPRMERSITSSQPKW